MNDSANAALNIHERGYLQGPGAPELGEVVLISAE